MQISSEFVLYGFGDEGRQGATRPGLATLVAVIAASPIVVAGASTATVPTQRDVPAGFDAVDIAILDWIVAEGRRAVCRRLRCDG
jgi:hypothetical protein